MAGLGGKRVGAGRPKGTVNRTTRDVREAIANIVQANVGKIMGWIEAIDDPAKRVSLFLDMCEYHIPKLARTEVTGPQGAKLQVSIIRFSDRVQMSETDKVTSRVEPQKSLPAPRVE